MKLNSYSPQSEAGCVHYDLYREAGADNRWAMIETWTSAAALEQHSKSAHVKAFQAAQKGNVEVVIKKYVKQ